MPLEKESDPPADIPSWLMTFSDVITLLMTFFILLLTFATSEPEKFKQMQVSMWGGGSAAGLAGEPQKPLEKRSILVRERPRSGRITDRGSEMPPIHSDPVYKGLGKGLAGLESEEERDLSTRHAVVLPLTYLVDDQDQLTPIGKQKLRMLAKHMHRQPIDVDLLVATSADTSAAVAMAGHLFEQEGILPGRIGVGRDPTPRGNKYLKIVLTRPLGPKTNGS